jgi:guanylate kinase
MIDLSILLIVGPSGAGKDTIKSLLLATGRYIPIVSHTTRPLRFNSGKCEVDGVDYHFVSVEEMLRLARARRFVQIKRYGAHYYGTSIDSMTEASGNSAVAVTDVDIRGADDFRSLKFRHLAAVFVFPPSLRELIRRLRSRQSSEIDLEDIRDRLAIALREVEFALTERRFLVPVVNRDVDTAVRDVERILACDWDDIDLRRSTTVLLRFAKELRHYLDTIES